MSADKRKYRWVPTALTLVAVLWLTLAPKPVPDTGIRLFEGADKIVHGVLFLVLTCAFLIDLGKGKRRLSLKTIILAACGVAVFAAADEWAQGAMGLGRTTDIYDYIADCVGILLAANIGFISMRRRQ